jgi:membrane fusion protein, heavy metal efflux system
MADQDVQTVATAQPDAAAPAPSAPVAPPARAQGIWRALALVTLGAILALGAMLGFTMYQTPPTASQGETSGVSESKPAVPVGTSVEENTVRMQAHQMPHITLATVGLQGFREAKLATGKIAFNEEFMTPVFSPYAGRVMRVLAKPGEVVKQGSLLLELYTPDLVQAESDLIGNATVTLAKAKNALTLAHRHEERQHQLYLDQAVALKDWQQAQADVHNAEHDVRAAEAALLAARDKLRAFGKSDAAIAKLEQGRTIDRVTTVTSPLAGTITARKVGPGQYIRQDNTDPLFIIADLSQMWMLANVYESDVPWVHIGQPVEVRVLAYPDTVFKATISYVGAAVDPTTHRVDVRAVVDNQAQKLKPEMFATFRIMANADRHYPTVPLSAIVRDGEQASVWVAQPDQQFARREVQLGLEQGGAVQILSGVQPGEQVVTEGSLLLGTRSGS